MKYLAKCNFTVPTICAWNSGLNPVGAEYMIMEKVCHCIHSLSSTLGRFPVVLADSVWSSLSLLEKKKIVTQIARHLLAAFQLRFDHEDSLYLSHYTMLIRIIWAQSLLTHFFNSRMDYRYILIHTF